MNHLQFLEQFRKTPERKPQLTLLAAFAVVILVGALLLWSPFAQNPNLPRLSFLNALFTSASATCVTGLTVTDVSRQFSAFGKLLVMMLEQIGGIGIMTFAAFFVILAGRKLTTDKENLLTSSMGGKPNRTLKSLLLTTMALTFFTEGIGAAVLTVLYVSHGLSPLAALKLGCFHASSAFCNAGFTLYSDNLVSAQSDGWLLLVIGILIILGGLGFYVIQSIIKWKPWLRDVRKRGRLPVHCTIVLWSTLFLIAAGTALFLAFEWNHSLRGMTVADKLGLALFQTVSTRTAGFNVIDTGEMSVATQFMSMVLMFIGGAPGSTAGGIKVTTAVIMLATMSAIIRGRNTTLIRNRVIPESVIREAVAISCLSALVIGLTFGVLLLTEARTLAATHTGATCGTVRLLFETISALSTNGLSVNHTATLSTAGRCIVIAAMYIGRLGPMTLALSVGTARRKIDHIHYPEEEVLIG